jgi:hypothetical protein
MRVRNTNFIKKYHQGFLDIGHLLLGTGGWVLGKKMPIADGS